MLNVTVKIAKPRFGNSVRASIEGKEKVSPDYRKKQDHSVDFMQVPITLPY